MADALSPQEEARFADERYRPQYENLQISARLFQGYAEPRNMWDWRHFGARRLGSVGGQRLLDLGCGIGEEAAYFAKLGADVTAVDVSTVGIEITKRRAKYNHLEERISAFVMRADPTEFPDESFDIVHGLGILHHIGIERGLAEVKRVLRPGGRALFSEHMGDSPLVERVKRLLWRGKYEERYTEDETPLTWAQVHACSREFRVWETRPFFLLSRLRLRFPRLFDQDRVKKFDHQMLRLIPALQHFCGVVVIYLEK